MLDLTTLHLAKGSHAGAVPPDGGACEVCLFEAYNLVWPADPDRPPVVTDDCPPNVSPVLHRFGMRLQDLLSDAKRQLLIPLLGDPGRGTPSPLTGTADDGHDEVRRHMAMDWSTRVATPMWLDATGMSAHATQLRALDPITDTTTRNAARQLLRTVMDEAYVARREHLNELRAEVRERVLEFTAQGTVAITIAVDAAIAVAVIVAATVAIVADVNAALAAYADVAFAVVDDVNAAFAARYWEVQNATYITAYNATKTRIEERFRPTIDAVHDSAIALFISMVKFPQ